MKACAKMCLVLVLLAGLAGCKQLQLGGPVTGGVVQIDLLNQPGASYQSLTSATSGDVIDSLGLALWFSFNDIQRSVYLGNFEVEKTLVDPVQLYLVTASAGKDTDTDHNGQLDLEPSPVSGTWHAIMPGTSLLTAGSQVSALTEAAYQHVRGRIGYVSDAELLALLDDFAAMVVVDINGDRRVDYADVLAWSRILFANFYRGDISLLDELANLIRDDAAGYIVQAAAESVLLNKKVQPVPPIQPLATVLFGTIVGDKVFTLAESPYELSNRVTIQGDLRVEAGVVILGRLGPLEVYGDIQVEGLPRNRVMFDGVSLNVSSFGSGVTSTLRNVDMVGGRLNFKIQKLLIEYNLLDGVNFFVGNIVASADSQATIRRNVIRKSTIVLDNSAPAHAAFQVSFVNNFIAPLASQMSTLTSQWEGPVTRLTVMDNTFNGDMLIRRGSLSATMDVRKNYWGPAGFPLDMVDTVLPDNTGPGGFPIITYLPYSQFAHPDTPGGL